MLPPSPRVEPPALIRLLLIPVAGLRIVEVCFTRLEKPVLLQGCFLPPQKYLFPGGETENTLLDVPYTLVRPGPCVECHRVGGCDATGQGCRTKALLPHRTTCHRLAAEIDNT